MFEVKNNTITITQGDSGSFIVRATDQTFGENDRALFTIVDSKGNVKMKRIYEMTNNAFTVRFDPADTKEWKPDKGYKWEVRYFIGAVIGTDDQSNPVITGGTDVTTPSREAYNMIVLDAIGEF